MSTKDKTNHLARSSTRVRRRIPSARRCVAVRSRSSRSTRMRTRTRCFAARAAARTTSKRAAARFGFTFEGVFRQHMIIKGRNRDTAWFSMLDSEWPARRAAFERWLDPVNFDAEGRQKVSLTSLNAG